MRTTTGTEPRIAVGTPARGFVFGLLLVGLLALVGVAAVASGLFKEPITPAPFSASSWRQTVPGGAFIPLATLARDPQGRVWVTDAGKARFAIYTTDGTFVEYWQPSGGPALNLVRENGDAYGAIAFKPDGSRFVLDVGNHRVLAYGPSGDYVTTWGSDGPGPGQLPRPVGIVVRTDGSISVLDEVRGVVETYTSDGAVLGSVNVATTFPPGENNRNGFAVDEANNIYVSEITSPTSGHVQKYSPTGQALTLFGATDPGKFHEQPIDIAIDSSGHLYVTQGFNRGDRPGVLIFNPDGTYVGGLGPPGSAVGQLGFPCGILVDDAGNLVVADSGLSFQGNFTNPSIQGYRINLAATP